MLWIWKKKLNKTPGLTIIEGSVYDFIIEGKDTIKGVICEDGKRILANQTIGGIFFTELETYANAGSSSILGIELNLFTELDNYLPLDGFFVSI